MKKNVSGQLQEALDLLIDYPGIKEIIDIKNAKVFLEKVSKSDLGIVSSFKAINFEEIEKFIAEDENSISEWIDALNKIKGVGADADDNPDDCIIFGGIAEDLASHENGNDSRELCFSFDSGNRASFNDKEGTWEEIYLAIVKYAKENLMVPNLVKSPL